MGTAEWWFADCDTPTGRNLVKVWEVDRTRAVALVENETFRPNWRVLTIWRESAPDLAASRCGDCSGSGTVLEWQRTARTCNRCQGIGWTFSARALLAA